MDHQEDARMETLLHIGLGNAVLAGALAIVVAVLVRILRRPALAHALWLLVLLKLVTPPLVSLPCPWPAGDTAAVAPTTELAEEAPLAAETQLCPVVLELPQAVEPSPACSPAVPEPYRVSWPLIVLVVWLAGSAAWGLLLLSRLARLRLLLREARPAPPAVLRRARQLAATLGLTCCPRIAFLRAAVPPFLWALGGRPLIVLPALLWGRLDAAQRDSLLLHELAHLRRRDHWVRGLELIVLALYWWHPVTWWARLRLQEAEEQCCDAWVGWALPQAARAYAEALVATVAFLSRSRAGLPVGGSGAGPVPLLQRRLSMILQGSTPRRLTWGGWLLVLGLGGMALPLLPAPAQQPSKALAEPSGTSAEPKRDADPTRDEVEALEARLRVKEAELRELAVRLEQAKRRMNTPKEQPSEPAGKLTPAALCPDREVDLGKVYPGLVTFHHFVIRNPTKAPLQVTGLRSSSGCATAQCASDAIAPGKTAEVSVHIDTRRFSGSKTISIFVQLDPEPTEPLVLRLRAHCTEEKDTTTRIEELERKLDALRKELESLKPAKKPVLQIRDAGRVPGGKDLIVRVNASAFDLPVQVDPAQRADLREVILYWSRDQGRTWVSVAKAGPDSKAFRVHVPCDGEYWFAVAVVNTKGEQFPADPSQAPPNLKIQVDTTAPASGAHSDARDPGEVKVNDRTVGEVITKGVPTTGPGWLRRSGRTVNGALTYRLDSAEGLPLYYVTTGGGMSLEPYVDHHVEIQGPSVYKGDLRANFMVAERVKALP
jgi:beta-lactamase regulating signal transducer with metallopeptidase domain